MASQAKDAEMLPEVGDKPVAFTIEDANDIEQIDAATNKALLKRIDRRVMPVVSKERQLPRTLLY